jgi:hypothetical protein
MMLLSATSRPPSRTVATRAVVAPPIGLRAPVRTAPVPVDGRAPLVWLMGSSGGAGVSTLARLLAPAADCGRAWPAPVDESPYVLIVARETAVGLAGADVLLRQHHAGLAGKSLLVGLVTVAARPGRMPAQIRRDRQLYAGLAPHCWRIGWHEEWMLTGHDQLPVWTPDEPVPDRPARGDLLAVPPPEVVDLGTDVRAAIEAMHQHRPQGGDDNENDFDTIGDAS